MRASDDQLSSLGCFDESLRDDLDGVGVQADFGFFDTDQRWNVRLQQDREKTQKLQGTV